MIGPDAPQTNLPANFKGRFAKQTIKPILVDISISPININRPERMGALAIIYRQTASALLAALPPIMPLRSPRYAHRHDATMVRGIWNKSACTLGQIATVIQPGGRGGITSDS